ncbi:MAG: tRNA (N6-threonylcarbamoyladenosine(37)-N6)-methyltransferase TrmO [Candidatus Omnitrophica bacterium]|nr:tRNA (N6-threonylcarbamoyladenosine(37)-N6)-methyltransferase TrmO [Candidatus Omnitrophota bacterium]
MESIYLKPIGTIRTPYKDPKGMPIQGKFEKGVTGKVELFAGYEKGLKDIEGFSHIILIYHFNRAIDEKFIAQPFLEDESHGIFAIRSPQRPNHIGISIVKLEGVEANTISFSEVDVLDGTPLLDIKPFVSYFDSRDNVKNGWLDKHFKSGRIPGRTKIE